MFTQIKEIT